VRTPDELTTGTALASNAKSSGQVLGALTGGVVTAALCSRAASAMTTDVRPVERTHASTTDVTATRSTPIAKAPSHPLRRRTPKELGDTRRGKADLALALD
jgi:hypothetical protein